MPIADSTIRAREDKAIYRALNILKSRMREPGTALTSPQIARNYLTLLLAEEEREIFVCLFLDAQHGVIEAENMFYGTLTQTSVYPREVVKKVIVHNAAAVIFAHNHPSGKPDPSEADRSLTSALKRALSLIDVKVLDHLVIGGDQIVSFAERGLL